MSSHRYSDEDFKAAIASSFSISETLRKLGLCGQGGSYATFHSRAKKLGIDFSHFTGQGHNKTIGINRPPAIPLTEVLVANSERTLTTSFKKRIFKEGLLKEECAICELPPEWQGKPITLQIDHINGDHFDHRIENLRLLCPNCHSQTDTFCSKNKKRHPLLISEGGFIPQDKHTCVDCGQKLKSKRVQRCLACYKIFAKGRTRQNRGYKRIFKIVWPSIEELEDKLKTLSYRQLGKELGVSDNAIRSHLKNHK